MAQWGAAAAVAVSAVKRGAPRPTQPQPCRLGSRPGLTPHLAPHTQAWKTGGPGDGRGGGSAGVGVGPCGAPCTACTPNTGCFRRAWWGDPRLVLSPPVRPWLSLNYRGEAPAEEQSRMEGARAPHLSAGHREPPGGGGDGGQGRGARLVDSTLLRQAGARPGFLLLMGGDWRPFLSQEGS